MKRNFKLLAAMLVLVVMVFTLASCAQVEQILGKFHKQHEYTADWSYDETNHWHAAICDKNSDCYSATSDLAEHTFADGVCSVCGYKKAVDEPAHQHNFVEGKCECGETDPNYVPPCTEHAYSIEVTKEATCTDAGEKTFTCTVCGYVTTQEVAPEGHDTKVVVGYDSTCTKEGLSDGTECKICGETVTEQKPIPVKGHTEAIDSAVEPGCTTPGKTEGKHCSVCNTVIVEQVELNPAGHKFEGTGNCTKCLAVNTSPEYTGSKTYYLEACYLPNIPEKTLKDGEIVDCGFFTLHGTNKLKTQDNVKNFIDGYVSVRRIHYGGKTDLDYVLKEGEEVIARYKKNAIEFTIPEGNTATVTIWWGCGDAGRQVGLYNANLELVAQSNVVEGDGVAFEGSSGYDGIKNDLFVSTFEISEAGTYFIGNIGGTNYHHEVAVTVTPAEKPADPVEPEQPKLEGDGTLDVPYVIPEVGNYVADIVSAYDVIFYTYTVPKTSYVVLTSTYGDAWLRAGEDVNDMSSNFDENTLKVFADEGAVLYIAIADMDGENAGDIPFTLSLEDVVFNSLSTIAGAWSGTLESRMGGYEYIFVINEDGTGTVSFDVGYDIIEMDITSVVFIGNDVIISTIDEYENVSNFNFVYDDAEKTLTGGNGFDYGVLTPYDNTDEPEVDPEITYETVVVIGNNVIFFSAAEIEAGSAVRTFKITAAGTYNLEGRDLFFAIADADGNVITKNDDYSYTFAEGEYTLSFSMFSLTGTRADKAYGFNVISITAEEDDGDEEIVEGSEGKPIVWEALPESVTFNSDAENKVYYLFTADNAMTVTFTWPTADSWADWFEMDGDNTTENNDSSFNLTTMVVTLEAGKTYRFGLGTNTAGEVTISISTEVA